MISPATMAETKMPVPAIDSTLKLNTAASAAGVATTGGIFMTILSRPGMAYFQDQMASAAFLNAGVPQANTNTDRMTHGIQARTMLTRGSGTAASVLPPLLAARSAME